MGGRQVRFHTFEVIMLCIASLCAGIGLDEYVRHLICKYASKRRR